MNKIVVSLGMAALGASSLQLASAQESTPPAKFWNITGSLRGFYDDNINTSSDKQESLGFEVSPGVGVNWETDTTTLRAGYNYALKYYEKKQEGNVDKYDQVHTFLAALDHTINERFNFHVADSFVIGQEPDVLAGDRPMSTSQYISGDNIRNYGTIALNAQLTPLFGLMVGYDNEYFNYDDEGAFSNSALLDRIQNGVTAEGSFSVQPETKLLVGAKFQDVDYTADEQINVNGDMSDTRNSRAYIGYLGAEHSFNPNLSGSIRAGVQYNDYYNDSVDGECNPYIQATGKYLYAPESFASIGFTQTRTASDVGGSTDGVVRDADASLLYATLHHRITPRLFGTLSGTFQNLIYNGGGDDFDGKTQQYYTAGVNLQYRFNPFLSSEIGYNFDRVESEVTQTYSRNRIYIGLTASY